MTRNAVNCVKLDFSKYLETECMCDFGLFVCLFVCCDEFSRIKQASEGDFRKQMYSSKHSNEDTLICLDTVLTLHQDKSMQQNKLSWLWFRTSFEMPGMKQIKWENQRRWGLWKHKEHYQPQHKCLKVYNWNKSRLGMPGKKFLIIFILSPANVI